jgi:hypothetical protein
LPLAPTTLNLITDLSPLISPIPTASLTTPVLPLSAYQLQYKYPLFEESRFQYTGTWQSSDPSFSAQFDGIFTHTSGLTFLQFYNTTLTDFYIHMKTLNGRYMDQQFISATFNVSKIPYNKLTGTFTIKGPTKFRISSKFGHEFSHQNYNTEFFISLKDQHGSPFDLHSTHIDDLKINFTLKETGLDGNIFLEQTFALFFRFEFWLRICRP